MLAARLGTSLVPDLGAAALFHNPSDPARLWRPFCAKKWSPQRAHGGSAQRRPNKTYLYIF